MKGNSQSTSHIKECHCNILEEDEQIHSCIGEETFYVFMCNAYGFSDDTSTSFSIQQLQSIFFLEIKQNNELKILKKSFQEDYLYVLN